MIADSLNTPWELLWGPDDYLWFTQRNGYVKRLNPQTGESTTILRIKDSFEWTSSGTLGMVLHPEFDKNGFVYLVYTYINPENSQSGILQKCVRYTYSREKDTLLEPLDIISGMFTGGSNGTFGSRLAISDDNKLLMTTGWGIRFPGTKRENPEKGGRILRFNLDGTIPEDNPIPSDPTFSSGHRNPQGLTITQNGTLIISEHGPHLGDEINVITSGGDYGWPYVCGECNGDWSFGRDEEDYCEEHGIIEPIMEWTPTIAPSSITYYDKTLFEQWNNSLILVTLKMGDMRILKLNENQNEIVSETVYFDSRYGRLRDHCIAPDGSIYICTSEGDRDEVDVNSEVRNCNFIYRLTPKN